VQTAAYHGAATLELNLDPSMGSVFFEETRIGPAGVLVPAWVEGILSSTPAEAGAQVRRPE
jgi:NAD-dependent deacetylase